MTAGITGVFWLPRMAEVNSTTLNAGAHAIPISAAATSWGTLAAAWGDATFTITRVIAEVGVGLQGVNGIAVLAKLAPFLGWTSQQGVLAAAMGAKCAANATAYTVASIAMPSLPEIIATNGAVVASANPAGAASGAFAAAEVAKTAMDIRAALVMETYEAATTATVTTPGEFQQPPAIAHGAGTAQGDFGGDPIQTAVAAAQAFVTNPGVVSAATQAANVAGGVVSSGVGTVGNIGATALTAATSGATMPAAAAAPAAMGVGAVGAAAGGLATTSAGASLAGGGLKLPDGWGAPASSAPAAAPVADSAAARVDSAARPAAPGANPLLGNRAATKGEDDDEHDAVDYGSSNEAFTDGRYAAEGVIGADLAGTAK
ncbi:PPE domain-containing protein [Nocardia mangyaensis]|uniref:PPE domain-containing protein n=1 Tax=Nocardia mangyaensis TaxID=2213200 RepID=UPI002675919C|nr:PPE domain-containing protein [Nocardia mangyaensis]MDO3647547.1 PPE domain-containing protein [Nocardia mangyaensis]